MARQQSDASRLLRIFNGMKKRCHNRCNDSYVYYGARGITVCEEWISSPARFIAWAISNGYDPSLQIDRIDNNKGYSPDNCRWATISQNQNNKNLARSFRKNTKSSRFKGVWKTTHKSKPWRAALRIHGKLLHLGNFNDEQEAAKAYDWAAIKYFGDYSNINFPMANVTAQPSGK